MASFNQSILFSSVWLSSPNQPHDVMSAMCISSYPNSAVPSLCQASNAIAHRHHSVWLMTSMINQHTAIMWFHVDCNGTKSNKRGGVGIADGTHINLISNQGIRHLWDIIHFFPWAYLKRLCFGVVSADWFMRIQCFPDKQRVWARAGGRVHGVDVHVMYSAGVHGRGH